MTGLILHKGAVVTPVSDIRMNDLHCPAQTKTYKPVGHSRVRDSVVRSFADRGFKVLNEKWALSAPRKTRWASKLRDGGIDTPVYTGLGARAFGWLNFEDCREGRVDPIGVAVRNSWDKSTPYAMSGGRHAAVCDNLSIWGDEVVVQKHTRNSDVEELTENLLWRVLRQSDRMGTWLERLDKRYADRITFNAIVVRLLAQGLLPGTMAKDYVQAYYQGTADPVKYPGVQDRLPGYHMGQYASSHKHTVKDLWDLTTDLVAKRVNPTAQGGPLIRTYRVLTATFEGETGVLR